MRNNEVVATFLKVALAFQQMTDKFTAM